MANVLVTGGSGFIAGHCILQLLEAGHQVRTTVRNLKREPEVRALLQKSGSDPGNRLGFAAADLESDSGWPEAVKGCDFALHVASPFPATVPKNDDELIVPAREGALRLLRAARDAGVKRVVLTSSFAAIGYGHPVQDAPFTETSWSNLDSEDATAYVKSKTLAERAAWDFIAKEGGALELAAVNPVGVFGPALGPDLSTSITVVQKMLKGAMPGSPKMYFGVVDVRDVADLHLRAMTQAAAKGERFLCAAGDYPTLQGIALMLKEGLGDEARKVPTRELPNWMVRLASLWDPSVRQILSELGKPRNGSNEKARRLLGWAPRTNAEAVVETGRSLIRLGLVG